MKELTNEEANERLTKIMNEVITLTNQYSIELSKLCVDGYPLEVLFVQLFSKKLKDNAVDNLLKNIESPLVETVKDLVNRIELKDESVFMSRPRKDSEEEKQDDFGC